jgi:hypothetical protein
MTIAKVYQWMEHSKYYKKEPSREQVEKKTGLFSTLSLEDKILKPDISRIRRTCSIDIPSNLID